MTSTSRLLTYLFGHCPALLACVAMAEEPKQWTPELMMQLKRVGSVQVSPDGAQVAFTVRSAVMEGETSEFRTQIHLAKADGSESHQLTQGDKSCDDPQWSPDGKWLAFITNRAGKKNLWLIQPDGGEAIQLTELKSDVTSLRWSPDGKSLACTALDPPTEDEEKRTKEKNDVRVVDEHVKLLRLYVVPVTDPPTLQKEPRLLTPGPLCIASDARPGRAAFDWSPDSKTIVFSHVRTPSPDDWTTADLSTVDVASGEVKTLLNTAAAESTPLYDTFGFWIAFTMSDDPPTWGGSRRICKVPSEGGKIERLAETKDGFGRYSELVGWAWENNRIYFTEVHGTKMRLMSVPRSNGSPTELSSHDGMSLGGVFLNASRQRFGFAWETLGEPSEAYVSAIARPIAPVRISNVNADLPRPPLGKTEVIQWKSKDGTPVEGLLTYPVGYEKGKRYPLLLSIHGGPMGVFTETFDGSPVYYPVATFAARGYLMLRPNPRGSSGYGAKFRYANYGDWGGGDYQDILSGVDHVIALGAADPDRLGVMGWSYGGFMTSWTITQTKRFKAASVGAGVTNLLSFTGTSDIPGFLPDYFGGEFWDQDKLTTYRDHSPMLQVRGVTTPTLIQHGERDERVPLSQGQELYNALKRQGCTTQMIVYPRTPHGIEEPRLQLDCMQRNVEWFEKYVGGSQAGATR